MCEHPSRKPLRLSAIICDSVAGSSIQKIACVKYALGTTRFVFTITTCSWLQRKCKETLFSSVIIQDKGILFINDGSLLNFLRGVGTGFSISNSAAAAVTCEFNCWWKTCASMFEQLHVSKQMFVILACFSYIRV